MQYNKEFSPLEDQIRECFGRVAYTHKTHQKMVDIYTNKLHNYKCQQIVFSVLTTSGALSTLFFWDEYLLKILTAIISVMNLWLSTYLKNFDLAEIAQKHREAAAKIWSIRESYLSLLTDLRMDSISSKEAIKYRNKLQEKLASIYLIIPQTNLKAYVKAQKALKVNDELTFSDNELDNLLPYSLRKFP